MPKDAKLTDEGALSEIWGITAPDCEIEDRDGIVAHVAAMQTELEQLRSHVIRRAVRETQEAMANGR